MTTEELEDIRKKYLHEVWSINSRARQIQEEKEWFFRNHNHLNGYNQVLESLKSKNKITTEYKNLLEIIKKVRSLIEGDEKLMREWVNALKEIK